MKFITYRVLFISHYWSETDIKWEYVMSRVLTCSGLTEIVLVYPCILDVQINSASFCWRNEFLNSNLLISNLHDEFYEWIHILVFFMKTSYVSGTVIGAGEIANIKQIKRQMTNRVSQEIWSLLLPKKWSGKLPLS